jgi:hypothetical protein
LVAIPTYPDSDGFVMTGLPGGVAEGRMWVETEVAVE